MSPSLNKQPGDLFSFNGWHIADYKTKTSQYCVYLSHISPVKTNNDVETEITILLEKKSQIANPADMLKYEIWKQLFEMIHMQIIIDSNVACIN